MAPASASQYTDLKASFRNRRCANSRLFRQVRRAQDRIWQASRWSLEYKVLERKLKGENQIVIDNLKLGERVSWNATSLPLDLPSRCSPTARA